MYGMRIPSKPDLVTPAWLTSRLNASGVSGTVKEIHASPVGAGQMGENARFELIGDGPLPTTLVGKFPSTNDLSRQLAAMLNNYAREVFFYSQLGRTVDICFPRCFAAEFDPESHDFVLILEDLTPGVQIDQMSECSTDQAALALEQLAKLHGPRWGDPSLAGIPLLAEIRMEGQAESSYGMFLEAFRQRYESRLTPDELAISETFADVQEAYANVDAPRTVIHIDYRLDNMMFGGPHPLAVFDWQSVNHGHALQDVSYFLGTSVSSERRAREERALLKHYLDLLTSYGVRLDWNDCGQLYRHFAPAGLNKSVLVSTLVGGTDRGNGMFLTMAKRSIVMCEELDTMSLLATRSYK